MYDTRHRIRNQASQGSRAAAKVTDSGGETVDPADNPESLDKDRPLREDIRLLGRLLGDTLREREGVGVFNLV